MWYVVFSGIDKYQSIYDIPWLMVYVHNYTLFTYVMHPLIVATGISGYSKDLIYINLGTSSHPVDAEKGSKN